ncbi:type II secretion system protein GspD, partial [bacterium]|nr:type II secretion system protein GspD [bacterium]
MRNKGQMRKKILIMLLGLCLIFSTFNLSSAEEKSTGEVQYVSIDFNDVDIRTLIKFISELTNQNFVIDQKVKGNVNIISPGKITVKEAYKVFESVLEVHGYTVIKAGEISKIVPAIMAKSKNIETKLKRDNDVAEDKIVTQLIPLKYADVNVITKLFKPLISKGSIILPYAPTNTLIVTDVYSNIKRLFKIINTIDVKNAGRQITVIPVEYFDALKLEKTLKTLFQARVDKKTAAVNGITKFVADQRTNTIIVLADEFNTEKIKELIQILDQQVQKSDAIFHVYYLENAKAEELATVLQSLSGKVQSQEKGKKLAPIVSEKVKITSDKATNSLIIMADKDDYTVLETIIKKLDIPRSMVYMEALIMEIQHSDDFTLGVEWMAGSAVNDVQGSPAGVFGGFSTDIDAFPGVSTGVLAPLGGMSLGAIAQTITIGGITFQTLKAAIRAMETNKMVRIISTPQIMVLDNEEAEISVGENRPYLTTSGTGDQNYNNYEY